MPSSYAPLPELIGFLRSVVKWISPDALSMLVVDSCVGSESSWHPCSEGSYCMDLIYEVVPALLQQVPSAYVLRLAGDMPSARDHQRFVCPSTLSAVPRFTVILSRFSVTTWVSTFSVSCLVT